MYTSDDIKQRGVGITQRIPCENLSSDLEYVNGIMSQQSGREPTPDVKRFHTQFMYKKELCRMQEEK